MCSWLFPLTLVWLATAGKEGVRWCTVRCIAPVRIDFAGGWTDVPPYSALHGGAVVNAAIRTHVSVVCRPRPSGISLVSHDLGLGLATNSADELAYDGKLDLAKAAIRRAGLRAGWELSTDSSAPVGGGLGASGALGVALVAATRAAAGLATGPVEAAELAHQLEVEEVGIAGGKQDQYAAALGGFLYLEFYDPEVRVTRLELEPKLVDSLQERLVLCYTGRSRLSGDTITRVMDGYENGDARITAALDGLRAAALSAREALSARDIERLARVVAENWRHQRALDARMSTPDMERIEAAAMDAGAVGGKACGSGAGGCMFFVTAPGAAEAVRNAVRAAGASLLPTVFDMHGVREVEDVT